MKWSLMGRAILCEEPTIDGQEEQRSGNRELGREIEDAEKTLERRTARQMEVDSSKSRAVARHSEGGRILPRMKKASVIHKQL